MRSVCSREMPASQASAMWYADNPMSLATGPPDLLAEHSASTTMAAGRRPEKYA